MAKTIGVVLSNRVTAGLVVDHRISGPLRSYPDGADEETALVQLHTDGLVELICRQVVAAIDGHPDVTAVGVALPGLVRNGVVEEAPNLPQLKGARIAELLTAELRNTGVEATVNVLNDADGVAAGMAAAQGKLDSMIRVWTLGVGIGFGLYPFAEGVFEGGHTVVSLDDRDKFCGCGGIGHMEGIMGHRAMRLRFLNFVKLWHKALAAGIASSIHMSGAGKFLITGFNARFVDLATLKEYLHQMVKMSPLQGYTIEIVEDVPETRVIGAAVAAENAANTR